jgi:hypothetical protein
MDRVHVKRMTYSEFPYIVIVDPHLHAAASFRERA